MTYEKACETLGLRPVNNRLENRRLAQGIRRSLVPNAPLRFKVAISVVIAAVPVVRHEV